MTRPAGPDVVPAEPGAACPCGAPAVTCDLSVSREDDDGMCCATCPPATPLSWDDVRASDDGWETCRHCQQRIVQYRDQLWRDDEDDPGDGHGGDTQCPATEVHDQRGRLVSVGLHEPEGA